MPAYDAIPELTRTVYLTNALGEHTGHRDVPAEADEWYASVSGAAEAAGWLPYLTHRDGREYLLLVQELVVSDNDDYGDEGIALWLPQGYAALDAEGQHARLKAAVDLAASKVPAGSPARLGYGRGTGIFGRDEAVVEIPAGALGPVGVAFTLASLEPFAPYGG